MMQYDKIFNYSIKCFNIYKDKSIIFLAVQTIHSTLDVSSDLTYIMHLPIVFNFGILFFCLSYIVVASPYEPGTPGREWSEKEIKVVREKVIHMLDGKEYTRQGLFLNKWPQWKGGKRLFTKEDTSWINRPMPSRVIRLAFHDCVGGCDGCLYWDDAEMNFLYDMGDPVHDDVNRAILKDSFSYDIPKAATNNGLTTIVKALEYIYQDANWPPGAETLEVSLKESGVSRADLWQFAANVALELEIERSNFACKYDKTNQQSAILEGGEEACLIKLHRPIPFKFGRKDCISDGGVQKDTTATYKTTKPERPFDHHGPSKPILDGMEEEFGLTNSESIALMAAHAVATKKPNERENWKYGWIGSYLGNMYYKYLAMTPMYKVKMGLENLVPDNFILFGDDSGSPVDGRRWLLTCFNQWKKGNESDVITGPCIFKPTYEGCRVRRNACDGKNFDENKTCDEPGCEQNFETPGASKLLRINKLCKIGFLGSDPKVSNKIIDIVPIVLKTFRHEKILYNFCRLLNTVPFAGEILNLMKTEFF